MKKAIFQLLLVALAVSSCATARYYGGFTPETARQDMVLLGPVSNIYYLDQDNHESFSDTLSGLSETLIAGLVDELGVPVSGQIELDEQQKEEATAFMHYLLRKDAKNLDKSLVPGTLDDILEEQGCRYGLLLVAQGMTRDRKGYRKEAVKGALLGVATAILSLGTVVMYSTPDMYASQVSAVVLDSQTDQIVFFHTTKPQETNPLHTDPVREQLSRLLKDFLK